MDPTPETALYPKNTARDVEPEPAVSVFFLSFFLFKSLAAQSSAKTNHQVYVYIINWNIVFKKL